MWNKLEKQLPLNAVFLAEIVEWCRFGETGYNMGCFLPFSYSHKGVAP